MKAILWVLVLVGTTVQARQLEKPASERVGNLPGERNCNGDCGQGEGDCDWDSDCLPGLKCKFDWWVGEDWCIPGPNTVNFSWNDWGAWGECVGDCGQVGERSRQRTCNPPRNGGYECPSAMEVDTEPCDMAPCNCYCPELEG